MKNEKWGRGEWDDEPDEEIWVEDGIKCLIFRDPHMGYLCGYVVLPEGHIWVGRETGFEGFFGLGHCGITFSKLATKRVFGGWTLGFDCNHFGDLCPYKKHNKPEFCNYEDRYVNIHTVRREVIAMANAVNDIDNLAKRGLVAYEK